MNDLAAKSAKKGEAWPMVRLGDVCELKNGYTPKVSEFEDKGSIPYFRISAMNLEGNEKFMREATAWLPNDKRTFPSGSIIFPKNGGAVFTRKVRVLERESVVDLNTGVCSPKIEMAQDYLYLWFKSFDIKNVVADGTIPFVDFSLLRNVCIPLPPLEVQKEIVEWLGKELGECERITENFRKIAELAEAEFKAELDEVFGELEGKCVREGEGKGEGEGEGDILTQRSREAEVRRVRLGDLGEIKRGKGIKRSETVLKGLPCVRYGEIYTSYNYVLDEPKSFISAELFDNCVHINQDDLVFTLTGENREEIAKTLAYLGKDIIAAGGDMAVWTNHGCVAMYLAYLMYSSQMIKAKAEASNGQIIVHASVKKLEEIQIPLPSLSVQESVVAKLEEARGRCDKLKVAAERGLRVAENLRKAILAEAFE